MAGAALAAFRQHFELQPQLDQTSLVAGQPAGRCRGAALVLGRREVGRCGPAAGSLAEPSSARTHLGVADARAALDRRAPGPL